MSALWTPGRAGVSPGFLVAQPGAVAVWNHRHSCLRPCVVCRAQPLPPGGPSHVINVMTSNIELYLAPARRPGGHGSTPTPPAPSRLRPESVYSTRVGIYWPRVVRTARRPHLPAVPPTLVQWHPTLVQCIQTTTAATTVTGAAPLRQGEQQLSRLGNPPHRRLEMPRHPKLPEAIRQHSQRHVRRRSPGSAWPRRRRRPQWPRPEDPYRSRRRRRRRAAPR